MRTCEDCGKEFETFQEKANHVRWNHKKSNYTDEGLKRLKEKVTKRNLKKYGQKVIVTERIECKCGKVFDFTFASNRKHWKKSFCSRSCASKFGLTEESKNKIREWHKLHPENSEKFIAAGMNAKNSRFSSKAERALAAALQIHGYNRHHLVKTQDITFDVDIASLDKKVWIESDGSWHFRKMHEGHNFELTKLRDSLEEQEAINRQVLLIRVNNEASTIEEQVDFILREVSEWDRVSGKIVKFRY